MKRFVAALLPVTLLAGLAGCAPDPAREYQQGLVLLQPDRADAPGAVRHLARAADAGVAPAAFRLAQLYRSGAPGVPRDARAATLRLRQAADAGVPQAQFMLGELLLSGESVPVDRVQARRWLEAAAEQELPEAHLELALAARRGELGLTREDEERHLMEAQHAAFHRPAAP
jgi:TPR repeat protein